MSRLPADFDVNAHQAKVAAWRRPDVQLAGGGKKPGRPRYDVVPMRGGKRQMNPTEKAYSLTLAARKQAGDLLWWAFEPIRLRLADGTFYKPDFVLLDLDGIEIHEVKGFMREAARVRLNVAAELYPFAFYLIRKKPHDQWQVNKVSGLHGVLMDSRISVPRGTQGGAPCSPVS